MFFRKLGVILYKNLLIRRTQWLITSLELILPILFVYLLCANIPTNCKKEGGKIEDIGKFAFKSPGWCDSVVVCYSPINNKTTEAVEKLNLGCGGGMNLKGFGSEALLEKGLKSSSHIGIVFPDGLAHLTYESTPTVISYKIRMHPKKNIPSTERVLPTPKLGDAEYSRLGPNYYHGYNYLESKFLDLQFALDKVLAEMITEKPFSFDISLEGFANYIHPGLGIGKDDGPWEDGKPREPLEPEDVGGTRGTGSIPVLICLAVLFMVPTITRNVVSEKQTGIAELLKSAGVSGLIQWLGWMINSLVPILFALGICTLFLFIELQGERRTYSRDNLDVKSCAQTAMLVYSDWSLVWFIFFLYILSTIALCFLISSLIKKPTIATTIAVIICVVTTFIPVVPAGNKIALSIFPNCAMSYAFFAIVDFEQLTVDDTERPFGARWDWELLNYRYQIQQQFGFQEPVSLMDLMGMMIGDIFVYSLLALYFENVLPSEHGVRRPWYWFNFREMYEGRRKRLRALKSGVAYQGTTAPANNQVAPEKSVSQGKTYESNNNMDVSFEPEGNRGTPVGIEVQNIYKNFGRKYAVVGVSLKMYKGDIFALLGHNGAGKTTLISILTGFFSPRSGTAIVDGHDIRINMAKAREHMGLCPQHNMLFENVSVTNQLVIFGMLRGMTFRAAKTEGHALLLKMNLFDKKSTLARKLSGGQKRKLSLAMALIGGTKVVVLDEPTSGMDPQARREIWDLLLELRGGRTILLTTHFMEEADVLGDRIGIMAAGKVQCCGTTAFLKKYYGTGFTLKLTLRQQSQGPSNTSVSTNANQSIGNGLETTKIPAATKILSLVQKSIPNASVKKDARSDANSGEVFLTLPSATATTAALTTMFTDLSGSKSSLGIETIGLQQTTMDEVFLRVGQLAEEERGLTQKYEWTEDNFQKVPKLKGIRKIVWQFVTLLNKRWLLMKRNWISLLCEIITTLLLVLGVILILKSFAQIRFQKNDYSSLPSQTQRPTQPQETPEPEPQPELPISLNTYESPISFYYSNDSTMESNMKNVLGSSSMKYSQNTNGPPFKVSLALVGKSDIKKYKRHMIIAVKSLSSSSITAMFNSYPYHAAPLALNTATNIALRAMQPSANNKIQISNHPWVRQEDKSNRSVRSSLRFFNPSDPLSRQGPLKNNVCLRQGFGEGALIGIAVILLLAFILFTAIFIIPPIEERICSVKQLQLMTGLQPVNFWAAHFVWDYTLYFIMVLVTIVLVFLVEGSSRDFLSINHGAGVLFLILMCYGFSSISLAYLLSLRSSSVAGGYSLVLLIHLFFGVILGYPLYGDSAHPLGIFYYPRAFFKFIAYCFPDLAALSALTKYMAIAESNMICNHTNSLLPEGFRQEYLPYLLWSTSVQTDDYSDYPGSRAVTSLTVSGAGQELFYLVLVGIIYVALLMMLEYKLCQRIFGKQNPPPFPPNIYDDDVYQEAERVNMLCQTGQVRTDCMVIQNLSRAFGGFAAVSQVNFGVHYGECFGLLGVNGAGKTTLFKMITGEILPSGGTVFGFGTTTLENPKFFFSNIGYCPQFDAIFVKFTGREMLELFGVLRGLSYRGAKLEARKWLQRFGLLESANVRCGKYSGGMKRRLSTALAMIADPALILLDEPTSGVDPVSRHQFWGILRKIRDSGQSIILTSHSMDECEALCSRLGIMVNGQFQCFGGVQHLKTKFAQGYSLLIKLKPDLPFGAEGFEEKMQKFEEAIMQRFQPCVLKDKHQNLLQYHLQNSSLSWDALFKTLESFKREFQDMIEDYSVNETSLEEVFLSFARMQYAERRVDVTTCRQICTCSC